MGRGPGEIEEASGEVKKNKKKWREMGDGKKEKPHKQDHANDMNIIKEKKNSGKPDRLCLPACR
jgi:hypothetical protein